MYFILTTNFSKRYTCTAVLLLYRTRVLHLTYRLIVLRIQMTFILNLNVVDLL